MSGMVCSDYFRIATWPRGVNQRQFIREAFFLSDRNYAILFFLCFV